LHLFRTGGSAQRLLSAATRRTRGFASLKAKAHYTKLQSAGSRSPSPGSEQNGERPKELSKTSACETATTAAAAAAPTRTNRTRRQKSSQRKKKKREEEEEEDLQGPSLCFTVFVSFFLRIGPWVGAGRDHKEQPEEEGGARRTSRRRMSRPKQHFFLLIRAVCQIRAGTGGTPLLPKRPGRDGRSGRTGPQRTARRRTSSKKTTATTTKAPRRRRRKTT